MSTENNRSSERQESTEYQTKLTVHERDQFTCDNCRETFADTLSLDVDHGVQRGQGGSNVIQNKSSKCRRCHEAKHGERDHAPTVRSRSTKDMIPKDFRWFPNFWKNQLPALSELAVDCRIQPKFNIAESKSYMAWHIPIGDLRELDRALSEMDNIRYESVESY